jgi:two-component system response regulator AtoC
MTTMADSLLIIEDEKLLGTELARHFSKQGCDAQVVGDLAQARERLLEKREEPLVVLADMSLPDGNALDLLEEVRAAGALGEWIVLTAYGSVPDSVRALRLGAFEFLEKPCSSERLAVVVNGARRSALAQRRLREQADAGSRFYRPETFVGRSRAAQETRQLMSRLTTVPFSALVIGGETGTGKGLVARILHHSGARSDGPMIEVNCAALPRDMLESELFGHEAGAFTGAKGRHRGYLEQADGGTLFLDEIAEMGMDLQAKLLTAIEEHYLRRIGSEKTFKVDVQVLVASNRDLEEQVRNRTFRSDLYHRLSVFRLDLPPLRTRLEDLEDLVPLFVDEYNAKAGRRVRDVPEAVFERMRTHDWPGNVRELRNVVERGVLFATGGVFSERWLQLGPVPIRQERGPKVAGGLVVIPLDGSMALDEMDSYIIQTVLQRNGYNVTATARALGTTRETLRYRIQKYGLNTAPDTAGGRETKPGSLREGQT